MQAVRYGVALLVLLPALSTLHASPQAQPAPPASTIAHVSSRRIATESIPGRQWQERLNAARKQEASELRDLQKKLEAIREQAALAADEEQRAELAQQEEQQRAALARATRDAQLTMQKLQREMNADMATKVRTAISALVKGRPIQIVLDSDSSVVWSGPGMDLTFAVIERLDKEASSGKPNGSGAQK